MKKIQYITPRCEAISLAAPRLLDDSGTAAYERLMIDFDLSKEAEEEAY